ncbi:MAG: FtsX-like permease family protein, partial [Cyclobacteriaceae bacterium]
TENIYYADPNFFKLFDFNLISGDQSTALQGPDKMIISERMALKYLGTTDALNQTLFYDGEPYTITGVLENVPVNSQLQFEFLLSMDTFMKTRPTANENWSWLPMNSYLLLNSSGNLVSLEEKIKNIPAYTSDNSPDEKYAVSIEPMEGLHFSDAKLGEPGAKGSMANIYILLAIGIMIMLLAVSNYVNLTVAQTSIQGKEVSVKKTLGASGRQIFNQYFIDSVLLSFLSTGLSALVIFLTLPKIESFMGHAFDFTGFSMVLVLAVAILFPLLLATISGLYPSLRFANISPVIIQKSGKQPKKTLLSLRTSLLMFQFTITSALIIGALIIFNQLTFLQNKDLGMNTDQMMVIDFGPNGNIGKSFETLKAELLNIHGVESAAFSSHIPGQQPNGVTTKIVDKDGQVRNGEISLTLIDYDFIDAYDLTMVAGRPFSADRLAADSESAIILNEAAVEAYGYTNPEDIIGMSYEQWGGDGTVIGVVKDFNFLSLHNDVGLLSLKIWTSQFQKVSLKLSTANIGETISALKSKWEATYPDIPFNYYFADDSFNEQYQKDQQFADIISMFTVISVIIGMLGLIAFATFWCERKKKEISIRKVLGAASVQLILNFYKEFGTPVLISFGLATPIAFYFGNQWLQQFAYQINIDWTILAAPLTVLAIIIGVSVGYQSLRVVFSNPVDNLKEE